MKVLETRRLVLRRLEAADAAFVLQLVNDPSWLRYIGDKGVRTLEDAKTYIRTGPVEMYARLGFGLYLVEHKESGERIGICGLLKRDSLQDVDLGFALLPGFRGQGYAFESAAAVMAHEKEALGISRMLAITSEDNHSSGKLLEKLGFRLEGRVRLEENGENVKLYAAAV